MTFTQPRTGRVTRHARKRTLPTGRLYALDIRDPRTGKVRPDYCGMTFQGLEERRAQHEDVQPFWKHIVRIRLLWQGPISRRALHKLELAEIRTHRYRYNYEGNEANPDRIPIYQARLDAARRGEWPPPLKLPVHRRLRGQWPYTAGPSPEQAAVRDAGTSDAMVWVMAGGVFLMVLGAWVAVLTW